jgi:CheY-like chemotaxis protein
MTHVLIVEDHEENRNLLKLLLEANGYRVTAAGDGLEALAAARRDRPDVIVSDALMPKMDGFALCRAWMQDAGLSAVPFIFYSAPYVRPEEAQFGQALGALSKTAPARSANCAGLTRASCPQPVRSGPTCRRCPLESTTESARIRQLPANTDAWPARPNPQ